MGGFAKEVKKKLPEIAVSLGITAVTAFFTSTTVRNYFKNMFIGEEADLSVEEAADYMNQYSNTNSLEKQ